MRAARPRPNIAAEQELGPRCLPLLLQLGHDIAAASTHKEIAAAAMQAIALAGQHDAAWLTEADAEQPLASFGTTSSEPTPRSRSIPVTVRGRQIAAISCCGADEAAISTEFVQTVAGLTGLALDNLTMAEDLAKQSNFQDELALVAELQRNLLPKEQTRSFPVYGLNRPVRHISGDFFDFFERPDGLIPFALGDVSGKGLNAALLMAKTASLFRCLAKNMDDPSTLLEIVNREICETASRGMFVTMVAGLYDPAIGLVRFANAGHEPPLVRLPDRSYQSFAADAPPLGILPDIVFRTEETNLQRGEFYIFSDGLTEFRYDSQEDLGVEGLIQLVESKAKTPLRARLEALLSDLDGDGWEARDDLTVLAIDDSLGGASR